MVGIETGKRIVYSKKTNEIKNQLEAYDMAEQISWKIHLFTGKAYKNKTGCPEIVWYVKNFNISLQGSYVSMPF